MKAQTTCSASYVNISLMFISFTENFFFFFRMCAHPCSAQAWVWNARLPQESLGIAIYFQPNQQLKVSWDSLQISSSNL